MDPTTWIMLILLLLLIGVVVFWLLRRPGDDSGAALDARDEGGVVGSEGRDGVTPGADPTTSGYAGADPAAPERAASTDPAEGTRAEEAPVEPAPGQTGQAPDGAPVGGTESHQPHAGDDELSGADGEAAGVAPTESRYDTAPAAEQDPGPMGADDAEHDSGHVDEDDPGRWREAAAIGATGAAGGAAVAGATQGDGTADDGLRDDEGMARDEGAHHSTGGAYAAPTEEDGVSALSDDEVSAGASEEPLHAQEQAPAGEPLTADEVLDAQGGGAGEEYPVGDPATTYRSDEGGQAVVVEEAGGTDAAATDPATSGTTHDAGVVPPASTAGTDGGEDRWTEETSAGMDSRQDQSWTDQGTATGTDPVADDHPEQSWTEQGTAAGGASVTEDQPGQSWTDQGTATGDETQQAQSWDEGTSSTTDLGRGDDAATGEESWTDKGTAAGVAPAQEGHDETWAGEGTTAGAAPVTEDRGDQTWDEQAPAEERMDQGADAGAPVFAESIYGAGSAEPLEDGSGPAGWAIKGNSGSMLFHTPESPSYDGVRAEVWFESEEAARAAGFAHWDRRQR
ncbi:hypothetical protein BJF86_11515 [Serinicoccus sp. CNJ-927]|uniref:sunset domain-containing protein n=1 Tax=unclassified Serinicoccus TaxID=2643101 RepID=UPI0009602C9D|nr:MULTISPECIES: hypothetical protein [unclassified Serinicoccus]OLT18084.1 hypothetical protein BJF80_02050 [Serinicoccus sp. CUA-874]OLT44792.1 hypothetical protein BJF86_11515 [Serinicoccus sp. CNJ-927]